MISTKATRKLRHLRWSLTTAVTAIAALGVGFLALVAILIDAQLRQGETNAHRQGMASRLAAIVYPDDDTGEWMTEGVADDAANSAADAVIVVNADGRVLYQRGTINGYSSLLGQAVADDEEVGVQGTVLLDGVQIAAAAAPYWDFETIEGAVIVALDSDHSPEHQRLRLLVWITAVLVTALTGFAAWFIAGRFVKPVEAALRREERFLATAAHDIRTPLSRIRALAESAQQSSRMAMVDDSTSQLSDDLRRLVSSAAHASDVVNDLLLAGRIDANQLNLRHESIRLDLLVAEFERTVPTLAVEMDEPVTVKGDQILLRHAIGNIISNAEQHGLVESMAPLIEASVHCHDSMAIVRIFDNGPGLRGVDTSGIFDRHANQNSGSGLGLWIARSVMEEHNGTIEARERVDRSGAEFVICLPATNLRKAHIAAEATGTLDL